MSRIVRSGPVFDDVDIFEEPWKDVINQWYSLYDAGVEAYYIELDEVIFHKLKGSTIDVQQTEDGWVFRVPLAEDKIPIHINRKGLPQRIQVVPFA